MNRFLPSLQVPCLKISRSNSLFIEYYKSNIKNTFPFLVKWKGTRLLASFLYYFGQKGALNTCFTTLHPLFLSIMSSLKMSSVPTNTLPKLSSVALPSPHSPQLHDAVSDSKLCMMNGLLEGVLAKQNR